MDELGKRPVLGEDGHDGHTHGDDYCFVAGFTGVACYDAFVACAGALVYMSGSSSNRIALSYRELLLTIWQ